MLARHVSTVAIATMSVLGVAVFGQNAQAASRMDMYEPTSGRLLYLGTMNEQLKGDAYLRRTKVCRPDGELIIESETRLDARTQSGRSSQTDLRHGSEALVELGEKEIELSYRAGKTDAEKTSKEARPSSCIAPDALNLFVARDWARLEAGDVLYPRLAVADAGRIVMFKLEKQGEKDDVLVVRMEPASWLHRRFVDPVTLHFSKTPPHRIVEFMGPTNYRNEKGERQPLRILYTEVPDTQLPCGGVK